MEGIMVKKGKKKLLSVLLAAMLCLTLFGQTVLPVRADAVMEPAAASEKESGGVKSTEETDPSVKPDAASEQEKTDGSGESSTEEKAEEAANGEAGSAGEAKETENSSGSEEADGTGASNPDASNPDAANQGASNEKDAESGTESPENIANPENTGNPEAAGNPEDTVNPEDMENPENAENPEDAENPEEVPVTDEILDKIIFPEEGDEYLNQLIVVFEDGTTADVVTDIVEKTDEVELQKEADAEQVEEVLSVVPVEIAEETTYEEAAVEVAKNDEVVCVQPNFLYTALEDSYEDIGTNDPRMTGGANWHLAALHAPAAWALQKTNGAVTVAVMDTGCYLNHEDIASNIDAANAYQAVNCSSTVVTQGGTKYTFSARTAGKLTSSFGTGGDLGQHGTHVCGIISAVPNNSRGIAGVSYNAKVVPVNVFNTAVDESGKTTLFATTSYVTAAYNYIFSQRDAGKLSNLRVVNLSLGGYDANAQDDTLHAAIKKAKDNYSILTVCAAGNQGTSQNIYPADFDECISVCSINQEGWNSSPLRTSSSDYNSAKDISAPGENIYSTYPNNKYATLSGTSMAAPCISGVLALIFAANSGLSADGAKKILYDTATDITGSANKGSATCAKGWDMYTGYGLANAEAAVRKAKGMAVSAHTKIENGGIYVVHSALSSSKVLDINAASTANKGNLQIYSGNGTNAQKFVFVQNSDKTWKIYPYCSGLVLDIAANGTKNGTNVQQYADNGTTAQKWEIQYNSDGTVTLVAVNSKLVLDISGAKTANKTNVQIYKSNNTNAQRFKLEKTGTIPVLPGTYTLECASNRNFAMDVKSASTANAANIQLYTKNGTKAQNFTFVLYQNGYYEIKTFAGKAVDVKSAKTANGTNVHQYALNNTAAQQWTVIKNSDGTYTFKSRCAGKVIDVKSNSMKNGSNIQIYTSNGTKAQKFYLVKKN